MSHSEDEVCYEAEPQGSVIFEHHLPSGSVIPQKADISLNQPVGDLKKEFCHLFGSTADRLEWKFQETVIRDDEKLINHQMFNDNDGPAIIIVKVL